MEDIAITENSIGIGDVPGFELAGVHCDVRENQNPRLDLALIFAPTACSAAGVFTQNDIKAAPVRLDQSLLARGERYHGIIINSGNANACTGEQGMRDAQTMLVLTAAHCGVRAEQLFVCSTGRIGRALPMPNIAKGIELACQQKGCSPQHSSDAAQAILTSDTRPKTVTARFDWNGQTLTVAGMAKGAGMIEPNMATMLAFIATDADVSSYLLQNFLNKANSGSFNAITVDGDMSTNDTVLCLANGTSGVRVTSDEVALCERFQAALNAVCNSLAKKIVGDGEKVTKLVTLKVCGAANSASAERVARAIGNSLLVKTSWFGGDPNWGRIMDAAGYARVGLVEDHIDLYYNDCPVLLKGNPVTENAPQWRAIVAESRFSITLNLNLGTADYQLLSADLSEAYVRFNKSE